MKRSTFVATGAAAGGALVLGFEFAPSGRIASFADAATTRLVGFVTIASDETITIVQPQAEMGQGVQTSIPMLVAEELGIYLEDSGATVAIAGQELAARLGGYVPDPLRTVIVAAYSDALERPTDIALPPAVAAPIPAWWSLRQPRSEYGGE